MKNDTFNNETEIALNNAEQPATVEEVMTVEDERLVVEVPVGVRAGQIACHCRDW